AIEATDLAPYRALIGQLGGVMPAHVIYPRVDSRPAGFSPVWLKEVLRNRLGFGGIVFSDDLSMEGASVAGGIVDRAPAAGGAGRGCARARGGTRARAPPPSPRWRGGGGARPGARHANPGPPRRERGAAARLSNRARGSASRASGGHAGVRRA